MRRLIAWSATLAMAAASGVVALTGTASAATCKDTGWKFQGNEMTAAVIGTGNPVTGSVASGCDIGVYLASGEGGSVSGATITGEKYFGVVVNGTSADVTSSSISNIGDSPFGGAQHGVGIYYTGDATGAISGNTVTQYQKGGIVLSGAGVSATVTDNTVTGLGPVRLIAQNGIEVYQATVTKLSGNTVSGNIYTEGAAVPYVSTGILLYEAMGLPKHPVGLIASTNHVFGNQSNITNITG